MQPSNNEPEISRPTSPPATTKQSDDPLLEHLRQRLLVKHGPEWMKANEAMLKSQEDFIRSL